ncbi:Zn-dependent hydrolase [Rouxiella sp. WC2420]|uniref:Zn-dependent hydrolase n=1 Tax=Rouxiella sp. WC2420 TaxID=3234145 RepID=A0AB39VWG1_9GAMM
MILELVEPDLQLAADLFDQLQKMSFDGVGITRDTYGAGEQRAHDLLTQTAEALGLQVSRDAALNLYMTLPGRNTFAPQVITGSHLDSVPRGGNYDGAAGVLAGIAVLAGWVKAGYQPEISVTVMAVRAEESAWFPLSYLGSKAAFGLLNDDSLEVRRFDNQQTLKQHLAALGGDCKGLISGAPHLSAANVNCFIELHIEQGPILENAGQPLGIVSGICGSLRYRQASVSGHYAHSGATPRLHRQDAVLAAAELVTGLYQDWIELEAQGHQLTVTNGQLATDALQADFSKVSGEVKFCVDFRSRSLETLELIDQRLSHRITTIAACHGVTFTLGAQTRSAPGVMDEALLSLLQSAADEQNIPAMSLQSGAGHDAALFAAQGVPSAMLFVRNANGSHNPHESMDLDDFAAATRVLGEALKIRSAGGGQ